MRKKLLSLFVVYLMSSNAAFAQEAKKPRDPFVSPFSKKKERAASAHARGLPMGDDEEYAYIEPLEIAIEGIVWGSRNPRAIIAGKVYSEGDNIDDINAKVVKIENGVVSIFYKGNMYEKTIQKNNKGERL